MPTKPLRFEGATMEDARRRAHDRLGEELEGARLVRSGKERYGGIYGFFQRQRFVIEVELSEAGERSASPRTLTPEETAPTPTLASLLDETTDTVRVAGFVNDFERELELVMADASSAATTGASSLPAPSEQGDRRGTTERDRGQTPSIESAIATIGETGFERSRDALPAQSAEPKDELSRLLSAAGLREQYLPLPAGITAGLGLARRLAALTSPPPPVLCAGEVVVLVGSVRDAIDIASTLAALSPAAGAVILASHRRLPASLGKTRASTAEEVGARVFEHRVEHRLSVVVVDAASRGEFVTQTVAGLHPGTIWGVVPASSTPAEVAELAGRCGRLDAIAIHGVLEAARPAALFGGRWPIAFVDGWRANPLTLAGRLLEAIGVAP